MSLLASRDSLHMKSCWNYKL